MRERNQVSVAIVGTALAAALVLVSMNLGRIPFVHPTHTYHAEFASADGLKPGDDVRVEGISVGSVRAVRVHGDRVRVDFTVRSGLTFGDQSRASIEVATVLGSLFLQVESAGAGRLRAGATIPLAHTSVPYTVVDALNQFGSFAARTDTPQLRTSLRTLTRALSGVSSADAKAALRGLAEVASTVAGKQREISAILDAANTLVATLNANSQPLVELLVQGDEFLKLLHQREQIIGQLLRDTARLGSALSSLITENQAQLQPMLANLDAVSAALAKQRGQLQRAITNLGHFAGNFANVSGTGPWSDLLTPVAVTPDNVIVSCGVHPDTKKGPCG